LAQDTSLQWEGFISNYRGPLTKRKKRTLVHRETAARTKGKRLSRKGIANKTGPVASCQARTGQPRQLVRRPAGLRESLCQDVRCSHRDDLPAAERRCLSRFSVPLLSLDWCRDNVQDRASGIAKANARARDLAKFRECLPPPTLGLRVVFLHFRHGQSLFDKPPRFGGSSHLSVGSSQLDVVLRRLGLISIAFSKHFTASSVVVCGSLP